MISDRHDKALSVALVEKDLDVVPVSKELEKLLERLELDCSVESLALLEDSDGKCLLDELIVLFKGWHGLYRRSKRCGALLADPERRLFGFNQLE